MTALFTILKSIASALPGLLALVNAFKRKEPPSQQDIADKAKSEIERLEDWKKHAKDEAAR